MGSMRYTMCEMRDKRGLTLLEIVIAISIIVILASIVIGVATHFDNKSKEKAVKSTIAVLEGALQEYYEYWGYFPDPNNPEYPVNYSHSARLYAQLYSTSSSRKVLGQISDSLIQNNPDMDGAPEIYDIWGTVLDYRYDPNVDSYPIIKSAGPDKEFGSSDDISNRD